MGQLSLQLLPPHHLQRLCCQQQWPPPHPCTTPSFPPTGFRSGLGCPRELQGHSETGASLGL